ncbi:MAG: FHA domain-containing protein [Eggerthellaceae bacterium]|nr:FHA domain-containing protein [Eggerthellaceae bacterium]
MAYDLETPSGAMYACFKQFGGISNKELASIVFSNSFTYGGIPLVQRLDERSFVTRNVVHVEPGTYGAIAFNDFTQLADRLCSLLFARYPGEEGRRQVVDFFVGEGCDRMQMALQNWGQNGILYRNTVVHLQNLGIALISEMATVLVLQFVAAGCLGSSAEATDRALGYAQRFLSPTARTVVRTSYDTIAQPRPEGHDAMLGLCQVVNGVIRLPPYPLSTDPEGTEVGSLATSANAINDVDATVSKRHVRIFQDATGAWYVEGLGSTNGTSLIRGEDGTKVVVEPPRLQRSPGQEFPPVPIYPQDMLRLAGTTFFVVVEMAAR